MGRTDDGEASTVWRLEASRVVIDTPWVTIRDSDYRLPGERLLTGFVSLSERPGVNVLALDQSGDVLLVRQYRPAVAKVVYDFPGGYLEATDDSPSGHVRNCAKRPDTPAPSCSAPGRSTWHRTAPTKLTTHSSRWGVRMRELLASTKRRTSPSASSPWRRWEGSSIPASSAAAYAWRPCRWPVSPGRAFSAPSDLAALGGLCDHPVSPRLACRLLTHPACPGGLHKLGGTASPQGICCLRGLAAQSSHAASAGAWTRSDDASRGFAPGRLRQPGCA